MWTLSKQIIAFIFRKGTRLKAETEGLIIAAQDQSLSTRLYHHKIIKDGTSPLCRLCYRYEESIDHILSRCLELAKTEYIKRHDNPAAYMHWKILKHYNIKANDNWYEHHQKLLQKMKKLPFSGICKCTPIKESKLINLTSLLKISKKRHAC